MILPTSPQKLVIEASNGWSRAWVKELIRYRELLYLLTWRDIKVRYKQTVFGAMWAVIQPLMTMVVFSLVFGKLAKVPSDGVPYPIFSFCALLPWQLFANATQQSGNSLVAQSTLLTKVYFPRVILPLSSVLAGCVDFAISFLVLMAMMVYYGIAPTWNAIYVPLFAVFAVITALSVGLWLSALNVKYRDVRYAIPFMTQFWMFASPVAYSTNSVPEAWRVVYCLNPMVGVIEGFRWALLGKPGFGLSTVLTSGCVVVGLLILGLRYFRRTERVFADVV